MDTAIVLYTRDLRVHDNPALAGACARARQVVPLFVVDWSSDADALDAWRAGRTGVPIVDAGMRQLAAEGYMHNRARMITASFLTRSLGIHWRDGYRHFAALLADGDVANNGGNWQWVAGTGNNPRPGRVLRACAPRRPRGSSAWRTPPASPGATR
jgi:deoxyribodipyrimidine photo-lyase